jgi:hypothetical protein
MPTDRVNGYSAWPRAILCFDGGQARAKMLMEIPGLSDNKGDKSVKCLLGSSVVKESFEVYANGRSHRS